MRLRVDGTLSNERAVTMKQLSRVRTTRFSWWRDGRKDTLDEHVPLLEEHAEQVIAKRILRGFLAGELTLSIPDPAAEDEASYVEYTGWFNTALTPVTQV